MIEFLWDDNSFDWGFSEHIDKIAGSGGWNSPYVLYRDEARTIHTAQFKDFYFAGWKIESLSPKEYFIRKLKGK